MKKVTIILFLCVIFSNCTKEDLPKLKENSPSLSEAQSILKENLKNASSLLVEIVNEKEIYNELKTFRSIGSTLINNKIYFREITRKGTKFPLLQKKIYDIASKYNNIDSLLTYLQEKDCYLYLPYPFEWYEENTPITVAGHPIDNDIEGVGFKFDSEKIINEVTVNESYANNNLVILIMPEEEREIETEYGNGTSNSNDPQFGTFGSGPNSIHTVYIGWVRLADYCGGIFEGDIELRIKRIQPNWDATVQTPYATEPVELHINYPKEYAKAAINNWTQYKNGGWYKVNSTWDTNWSEEEFQQGIIAYDYDWDTSIKKTSVSLTYKGVGFTVSFERDSKYEGDFLGKNNEWYRNWFYLTNLNPTPHDGTYKGWTIRSFGSLKFTTPHYTLYY